MRCLNCGKSIPSDAKVCKFCEAAVEDEITEEEQAAVWEMLGQMPPEAIAEFHAAFEQSKTGDEFANRILVGVCPKCGSAETGSCENDPEIEDPLVGRCYQCGQLWCVECGQFLEHDSPSCSCWDENES